jgi:endonuclease/exonuclease/phosphatase family metal-dependent hydrolase
MQPGKNLRTRIMAASFLVLCAQAALSSCSSLPDIPPTAQAADKAPRLRIDMVNGTASMDLTVMTYNVAGLPWPIKKGRRSALKEIAAEIDALRDSGRAPDVIVLQEAFTESSARIGRSYPHRVRGPLAADRSDTDAPSLGDEFRRERKFLKGERLGKVMSSGLYILSDYPVSASYMTPFRRTSCAGYDCLANKGAMIAVIDIPGAPEPVQILNTHLNSNRKSGVPEPRALAAHRQQVDELDALMARARNDAWPFIYAGDFNTKKSQARFSHNDETMRATLVTHYCLTSSDCDARMNWAGETPWLDTQDLQGFESGSRVSVRPVRAEEMFAEPVNGRVLSDHDAYVVTYRLTWKLEKVASAETVAFDMAAED